MAAIIAAWDVRRMEVRGGLCDVELGEPPATAVYVDPRYVRCGRVQSSISEMSASDVVQVPQWICTVCASVLCEFNLIF